MYLIVWFYSLNSMVVERANYPLFFFNSHKNMNYCQHTKHLQSSCDLPRHRKHIGACVHHNEEEDPCQIEALQSRVVLHHQVQKICNLFHQNRVKSQKQLEKQRIKH